MEYLALATQLSLEQERKKLFLEQFAFFEFPSRERSRSVENDFPVLFIARGYNLKAMAILNTLRTMLPIRGPFKFPHFGHSKYQLAVIFWDGLVSPAGFGHFSNFIDKEATVVIVDMAKHSVSVKFDDDMFGQTASNGKVIRVFVRPPRFFFDWFPFPWRAIMYLIRLKKRVAEEIRWIIVNEGKLEDEYGHRWRF